MILGAAANACIGEAEQSAQYAAHAIAVVPENPMLLYNVAGTYGMLGRTDACVNALEKAVSNGWGDKSWLEHGSDLDSIREEARYLGLLRAM